MSATVTVSLFFLFSCGNCFIFVSVNHLIIVSFLFIGSSEHHLPCHFLSSRSPCLVLILWFSCGVAVLVGEAAKTSHCRRCQNSFNYCLGWQALHSTLYTPHAILQSPHPTFCSPHFALYTRHFSLYNPHFIPFALHSPLNIPLHSLFSHCGFRTPPLSTVHSLTLVQEKKTTFGFVGFFCFRSPL